MTLQCGIRSADGVACAEPVDCDSPLNLCARHLSLAADWSSREVGLTDVLPSPCLACGSRVGVRYPSGWICAVCEWRVGELPDGEVTRLRVDVVYYIRSGDRIKIGTSGNPRGRLAALPYEEVLAFERGDRMLERRRHEQFAAFRMPRSEWFHVHDALLAHVAEVASGVSDPWERYAFWVSRELALRG